MLFAHAGSEEIATEEYEACSGNNMEEVSNKRLASQGVDPGPTKDLFGGAIQTTHAKEDPRYNDKPTILRQVDNLGTAEAATPVLGYLIKILK